MIRSPGEPVIPRAQGMVSRAILRVPEFRARYRSRFGELLTNVLVTPSLMKRIDERAAQLATPLIAYDPDLAAQVLNYRTSLKSRLANRARKLAAQLSAPEPGPPQFVANAAKLSGWRVGNGPENAKLGRLQEPGGQPVLWIAAAGPSTASWRAKLELGPGQYVFEGLARTAGVKALRGDDRGEGAGLRISGSPRSAKLVGNTDWTKMTYEFQVTEDHPEVELICELRATAGEVWFDESSLRLVRR